MKQFTFAIFLFSLIIIPSQAQRGWRLFDQKFGEVKTIHQSSDGTLWLGAIPSPGTINSEEFGLWRYGDSGWQRQTQVTGRVLAIHESSDGTLWLGGYDVKKSPPGTLWRYGDSGWQSVAGVTGWVNAIHQSSDGTLWLGRTDGLWRYEDSGWQSVAGVAGRIFAIHQSGDGTLWVGGADGLWRYDGSSWQSVAGVTGRIDVIHQSSDGTLWLGGADGLWRYDGSNWQSVAGVTGRIDVIHQSSDGPLWLGGADGLWHYDDGGWQSVAGVAGRIFAIHQSSDGTLWVGGRSGLWHYGASGWQRQTQVTGGAGVMHQSSDGTLWVSGGGELWHYDDSGWQRQTQVTGGVWTIHESSDGTLWVGTSLDSERAGGWTYLLWRYDDSGWQSIAGITGRIDVIHQSSDGTLWFGGGDGLWRYDDSGWQKETPVTGWINVIYQSSDGTLWLGGGDGLWRNDGSGWQSVAGVTGRINVIYQSSDGTLWVSGGDGLWRYDDSGWQKETHGVTGWINVIYQSSDGTLWVGGFFDGFFGLWSYEDSGWELVGVTGEVYEIYQSRDGTLWVGGMDGLWCKKGSGNNEFWFHFDLVDYNLRQGLPNKEVRMISESQDGSLWVGSSDGLTKYFPSSNPPNVDIVSVNGDKRPTTEISSGYVTGRPTLAFKWTAQDLETLTDYIRYQYSIDGKGWIPTRIQQHNTSFLSDGQHTFSVRAFDYDGNSSRIVSFDFTIDTNRPNIYISKPLRGEIIAGKYAIQGGVLDSDVASYSLFYALGSKLKLSDYQLIYRADQQPNIVTLAFWPTMELTDGLYSLRLVAVDQLGHQNEHSTVVTVDNTPPKVQLLSPQNGQRLAKENILHGEVSDVHLERFRLEFTTEPDPQTTDWRQIYQQIDLRQAGRTEEELKHPWQTDEIQGNIFIRLTATDTAGNVEQQTVQVEVPEPVQTRKGGEIRSQDDQAILYIPPNSLSQDTILTINRVVNPSLTDGVLLAYQLEPSRLKFSSIKPFTLTISYRGIGLTPDKQPLIFRRVDNSQQWKLIGGMVNTSQQTVSTVINQLGQYGIKEMVPIQADNSAQLLKESLTCQPRVFSPIGRQVPNTETTISFQLDKSAKVSIKVYNVAGRLVNWLAEERTFSEGKVALPWDGRDHNGQVVATGLYIVAVTVDGETQTKVVNVWNQ
ncbi:MAG: FlgD immunoglobulin-like domain containing protein [Candidatus Poribacteria bacterium]|nr:FlgD immunoglobulin-like domain containing protein [Candidatus Poribacteria bacterium]